MVNPQGCPYVPPDPLLVHQAAQAGRWHRQVFMQEGGRGEDFKNRYWGRFRKRKKSYAKLC